MKIKPFIPQKMAPKNIDWEFLIPWIGKAREAVGRFDERLKKASVQQIERLNWDEAIASLRTQRVEASKLSPFLGPG